MTTQNTGTPAAAPKRPVGGGRGHGPFGGGPMAMLKGEKKREDEFINTLMGRRRSGLSVHAEDHIARDNRVSYQALGTICGALLAEGNFTAPMGKMDSMAVLP